MTSPSSATSYRKLRADYGKAMSYLVGARDYLERTYKLDTVDSETYAASQAVDQAIRRVNAAYLADKRALGVDTYTPYGGRGRRS